MFALFFNNLTFDFGWLFTASFLFIWEHVSTVNDEIEGKSQPVLEGADEPTIREVVREAEFFLEAQLKAGLAADQRAMSLAGTSAAVTAVLIGGTISLLAAKVAVWPHVLAILPLVICLMNAIRHAFNAAKPVDFYYAGNNPRFWVADVQKKRSLISSLAGQASLYAKGILLNGKVLDENHRCVRSALNSIFMGSYLQ